MSTTPAMAWPLPSVIPEAVRNSVSMRSLITGARAGISERNSSSLALCQAPDFRSDFATSANSIRPRLAGIAPAFSPAIWDGAANPKSSPAAAGAVWADQARSRHTTGNHLELVKVHDPPLQRSGRGLGAIRDSQLAE